jgi:hypothetical protein
MSQKPSAHHPPAAVRANMLYSLRITLHRKANPFMKKRLVLGAYLWTQQTSQIKVVLNYQVVVFDVRID